MSKFRRVASRTAQALGAGAVFYLVMSACSAAGDRTGEEQHPAAGGSGTGGGALDAIATGVADAVAAIVDSAASPVPSAKADTGAGPLPPESVTEACSHTYMVGATTYYYAEHLYPGLSEDEIATTVTSIVSYPGANFPIGYSDIQSTGAYVRDGSIAYACSTSSTLNVRFVRRR